MLFNEIVDLVLLAVNGGQFSSESAVQRPDVEAYVPAAIDAAIREEAILLLRLRRQDGSSEAAIGSEFYTKYKLVPAVDSESGLYYVELPSLVSIPGLMAIQAITPVKNPSDTIILASSVKHLIDMDLKQAWIERYGDKTRIYFKGVDQSCPVYVFAMTQAISAGADDDIKLPGGLDARVIAICVAHFRQQRDMPADVIVDNHDVNKAA